MALRQPVDHLKFPVQDRLLDAVKEGPLEIGFGTVLSKELIEELVHIISEMWIFAEKMLTAE